MKLQDVFWTGFADEVEKLAAFAPISMNKMGSNSVAAGRSLKAGNTRQVAHDGTAMKDIGKRAGR
jgi:hypothetical protein